MNHKKHTLPLAGLLTLLLVLTAVALVIILQQPTPQANDTPAAGQEHIHDFYSLHITTTGDGVPFAVRDLWIDSHFTMYTPYGRVQFAYALGRIRGRGRSSWSNSYMHEKRPLRIRFDGTADERLRQMAGSNHAARNWVLRSNHMDKSLLRDYTALFLGGLLPGMYWQPFAAFVHLYVNGEYMGVYMLADEREAGPGRAQLTGSPTPATSEFFIEMDWRNYRNSVEGVDFFRVNTHPEGPREGYAPRSPSSVSAGVMRRDHLYNIRYPAAVMLTPAHFEYLADYFMAVGVAMRRRDFDTINSLVCINSLIDHYFVHELFHNVDAGMSSTFFQLRGYGQNRRLELGPLWDFDVTAGNAYWLSNQTPYGGFYVSRRWYWAEAIHQTPELLAHAVERWEKYFAPAVLKTIDHIHQMAVLYENAFYLNFERFPILGVYVWPNPPQVVEIDSFLGQVEYFLDFLYRRLWYLNTLLIH